MRFGRLTAVSSQDQTGLRGQVRRVHAVDAGEFELEGLVALTFVALNTR
jgi:protein involved in temperature-dependent protein secretion